MKNRLRTLRTQRNWSQANLAERLDVSRQTINALETGKSDPSLPLAFKIAELFNCRLDTIFFLEQKSMFARQFSEDESFEGLSQQAVEVLRLAQNESKRLRHNFVGTEQILLGLIAEQTSFSAQLLQSRGVTLWQAQAEVQKRIGDGSTLWDRHRPLTPRAKRVFKLALEEASRLGHGEIGTEHLLLGLIREKDGTSAAVLRNLGINLQDLEQQVLEHLYKLGQEYEESPTQRKTLGSNWSVDSESVGSERPSDLTSGEINARLSARLVSWVEPHQLGRAIAQTGFWLPNGDVLVPRLAFISRERLKRVPLTYPTLVPDLVVEIKSAFDRFSRLQEKIELFLKQGAQVGLIVDPDEQSVTCYHQAGEVSIFRNGDTLTVPEVLPGWELPVSELWPSVFD